jgi:hypothetical protein
MSARIYDRYSPVKAVKCEDSVLCTDHAAEVERLTREIRVQRNEIEILKTVRDGWQQ